MNVFLRRFLDFAGRNKLQVLSYAVIILCAVASWFQWQWKNTLALEHADKQRSGEAMLQSLTSHARVTAEIAKVTAALDLLDKNLVNEGDLADNLGYFYQIESLARVKFTPLTQMSSQPVTADKPYKTVPFKLRTTGTYRQMLRVLRELETGPRPLRITQFNLAAEGTDADLVSLDLTVELLARP